MTLPTRDQLVKRRGIVLLDMAAKMEAEDFHGVADCAMDAREIDAALKTLEGIKWQGCEKSFHSIEFDNTRDQFRCIVCAMKFVPCL